MQRAPFTLFSSNCTVSVFLLKNILLCNFVLTYRSIIQDFTKETALYIIERLKYEIYQYFAKEAA